MTNLTGALCVSLLYHGFSRRLLRPPCSKYTRGAVNKYVRAGATRGSFDPVFPERKKRKPAEDAPAAPTSESAASQAKASKATKPSKDKSAAPSTPKKSKKGE